MKRVLVINGPNLNLLGVREPGIYGSVSLASIEQNLKDQADNLGMEVSFFQSNHEGQLIDRIQAAMEDMDGLIMNPGALTHYSYAIRDAVSAVKIPLVEVHMSNIHAREPFRHTSVIAPVAIGQIAGFGESSYYLAMNALHRHFENGNEGDAGYEHA